jgi:uncharacterized protein (TIGR02001 family)
MRMPEIAAACGIAASGHRAAVLLLVLCLSISPVRADGWRSTLVVTSDYVFRGVSQSGGNPAIQGSVAFWHPTGWYAGAWASSVETARRYYSPQGTHAEVNLFLGFGKRLSEDWSVDAKAVRYLYPNDPAPVSYNYNEFSVGVAWRERLYANLSVAPGTTLFARTGGVRNHTSMAAELSYQQPLSAWFTWLLGGGYHEVANPPVAGYYFGATGLSLELHRVSFELMHFRTSNAGIDLFGRQLAGPRTVFTASMTF